MTDTNGDTDTDTDSDTDIETNTTIHSDTAGGSCDLPEGDELSDASVTITIRNDSPEVRYVLPKSPFSCNYALLEIEVGGEPLLWDHPKVYPAVCGPGLCEYGCSDGGDMGLIINPGASAQVSWNWAAWHREPLTGVCQDRLDCVNPVMDCDVLRVMDSGQYTARVQLAETCPSGGDNGECPECVAGVCEMFVYEPDDFPTWKSFEASAFFPDPALIVITD